MASKCATNLHRAGGVAFATCLLIALLAVPATLAGAEVLQTAAAVRDLSVEQAQAQLPVRLRGVVTFFDESLYSRFIQDATAGIYLRESTNNLELHPGELVEVEGVTSPGEYAPVIIPQRVTVLGQAALPEPKAATYEQLASGKEDSQFVEIAGIVRWVNHEEAAPNTMIELATGGGRLMVYAHTLPTGRPEDLLDSTVQVRGVCSTQFNRRRQLFAIRLMVPRAEDLIIVQPAPADPYAVATRPIDSLLQFSPTETYGHRVKVAGRVIYQERGRVLYLEDGEQGLEVQTRDRTPLQLGDQVEALGFEAQGDYTPVLQDAVYRRIASDEPPPPTPVTPDEALGGSFDCRLVTITGRLIDRALHGSERYLILQNGQTVFNAYLKQSAGTDVFSELANNSHLQVTGVCRIEPGDWWAGEAWRAKAFRVHLRSPGDVTLLQSPPWWTFKKVLWMAGVMALVTLAAFGWVMVLHRQVAERSRQLELQIHQRQRAERWREIEQERARVAHDLHDELGAGLTEVNMLSSLARSPATLPSEKQRYLEELTETARRMVTSLDEIVWAINPRNDTIASLASYFGAYAQRLLDLASVSCGLDIAEDLPDYPLDPKYRQQLFLAFKEALTNVVRHAGAAQVWLRIAVHREQLEIVVTDNGRGFNPDDRRAGSDGVVNMTERLQLLGGECLLESKSGQGTKVRFFAPLPKRLL